MNEAVDATYGGKTRIRACGICIEEESILLVRHKGLGKRGVLWSPPGGGVNYMESAKEALGREFKEETQLEIEVGELLFVNEYIEKPLHAIELFFQVKVVDGRLEKGSDPEHMADNQILDAVRFVSFKDLSIMDIEILHNVLHNINNGQSILNMRGYFHFSA